MRIISVGDLEQLLGKRHQFIGRQAAVTLVHGLGQRVGDAGADPDHRGLLDAEFHGDRIGGPEADAANIARQSIGVLGHHLHRIGAVGLVDSDRTSRADAVRCRKTMMSRTTFCSAQAPVMRLARIGPIPGTSRSRSGSASITSKTVSPKAFTSFLA